jgi:iron complex outermembrane receptor protein
MDLTKTAGRPASTRKLLLLVGACLSATAGTAHAQTSGAPAPAPAAESSGATMGEVVVTARRRAEDVSKVPIAITAFSGATLDKKGIVNISDLTKITPGLNISAGGSKLNPFITIRGQTRGVTGNINAGVITYMNEVPMSTQGSLIPTYDMDNIQVLKGPQGTLFGRNSIGGAVLVYTKEPTNNFGGYAKVDIGSFNFKQFEGAINVPVWEDKLAVRLSTQIYQGGSFIKAVGVTPYSVNPATLVATPGHLIPLEHDFDDFDARSYRASVRFAPVDWIKNVTVADYTKVRGGNNQLFDSFFPQGFQGNPPAIYLLPPATITAALTGIFGPTIGPAFARNMIAVTQCGTSLTCDYRLAQQAGTASDRTLYTNIDPRNTVLINKGISNTTTINIGDDHTLKNIFGYRSIFSYNQGDNEGASIDVVDTSTQVALETYTDELQLSGSFFEDRLKYTLGGFYYREQPNGLGGNQGLEVNVFQGLSHTQVLGYYTNKSEAIYGQVDYSLDDFVKGLSVTAGLRQTWDSVKGCVVNANYSPFAQPFNTGKNFGWVSQDQCQAGGLTTAAAPGAISSISSQVLPRADFKKLTYTFGANWQFTPDAMVYVAHRRGYRAGNYNSPLFDAYLADVQTFAPETLTDWEVGTKLRWNAGDTRGTFDLAVFTGKDKGNQFPVPTSGLAAGVCVPQAIGSGGRASNCTTLASQVAFAPGTPGLTVRHSPATTPANVGDLTIRGFELGATVTPAEWLTLGVGMAYVDYKVDAITIPTNLSNVLRAGNIAPPTTIVLAQQPKYSGNGNITINYPDQVIGGNLSANLDVKYTDSFLLGASTVEGYTNADLRVELANIQGKGVDVAFYVRNLFDSDYNFGTAGSQPNSLGVQSFIHAPPRNYGVSVRYTFGS